MTASLHYRAGIHAAASRLGLIKTSGYGNVQQVLTSATGDEGRARNRTSENPEDQARSAFMNHDLQMRHPADASAVLPVGSGQSKVAANASGYALHGRTTFQGLKISIEQRKGAVRKWKDPVTGDEGSSKMLHPYGYIRMTEGADGDHVDVYVGPNENATHAFIVNQMQKPKDRSKKSWTKFDEQKVMLGFRNATEAKNAYLAQYDDPRFFGSMVVMAMDEFKKKVLSRKYWGKKLGSNMSEHDHQYPIGGGMGPSYDHVPGDDLGVLGKYRNGNDTMPGGWEADGTDTISRAFSDMDSSTGVRVLDGSAAASPASPGV